MFSILVKLAVAAVAVSAYEPCEPVTPSSTSSSAGPGPTNPGGVTTLTQRGKCVDLQAANYNDGTVVQIYDCNGTGAQNWNVQRSTSAAVTITGNGKTLCLDAGSNPTSGSLVKVWTCYSGLPQQNWFYTNDNRLALSGLGLCLDLPSGNTANGQQLQVWACGDNNPNQAWGSSLSTTARRRRFARSQLQQ